MKSKKSLVMSYLEGKNTEALQFLGPRRGKITKTYGGKDYYSTLTNPLSTLTEIVYAVLCLSKNNSSFVASVAKGAAETGVGRRRSVLDIWRHIKQFRPEVTIFEVMNTLYQMTNIRGWYCGTVCRRVFWVCEYNGIQNRGDRDEFRLLFEEWSNIHLEEE